MYTFFSYKYNIYLLIFFSVIGSIDTSDEKMIILNQHEYELNISEYNLTILNLNIELYNMKYSLLAYINDSNCKCDDIFSYFTPYYNHFWIFYISDLNIFNQIISKYKCINDYMIIYGIIIPKSLRNELPKKFGELSPSIFFVEDNYTIFLEKADFRKNEKIVYFSFDLQKPISRYPEIYFFITSLLLFLISCFILMFWNIFYRITKDEYITSVQKYCNIFPYLNLIVSTLLLIKCIYIKGKDPYLYYEYMSTIDTIYISMNSIQKILVWYFLFLISTGFKLAIQTITRKMRIFYIKMIIFIFLMICIDITIYNINEKAYNYFCEIKNIIFYLITTIIILKEIKKTMKLLFKKLHYAETLIPEFTESLSFKINIFKQLKNVIISYPIIFIAIFIIHKIIPVIYDSTCLKFVDYYFCNIFLLINILIIFGPKVLPPNYDVDFAKDLEEDSGKIYKLSLIKNEDGTILFNPIDKKEALKIKQKKIPLIIFGPSLSDYNNLSCGGYNFIINKYNEEKEINQLYSTLYLGFSQ